MSFSFQAAGSREECIESLNGPANKHATADGQIVRGVVMAWMADAPDTWNDDTPIRYTISAYGHHGTGTPSLTLAIATTPPETERGLGGAADDAASRPLG